MREVVDRVRTVACLAAVIASVGLSMVALTPVASAELERYVDTDQGGSELSFRARIGSDLMLSRLRTDADEAREAKETTGVDPDSGLANNIAFYSRTNLRLPGEDRQLVAADGTEPFDCVNPPQDHRATYSVGVIGYATSPDTESGFGIDEQQFADEFIARKAPPPDYAEKPQVRMVFNVRDNEWAWSLGDHWENRAQARDYLDELFSAFSPRVVLGSVVDDVCGAVEIVEFFLRDLGDEVGLETRGREVRQEMLWAERQFDEALTWLERTGWCIGEDAESSEELAKFRSRHDEIVDDFETQVDREDWQTARNRLDEAVALRTRVVDAIRNRCDDPDLLADYREALQERIGDLGDRFDFADNIVFENRSPLGESPPFDITDGVFDCVNPPEQLAATYSIGFVARNEGPDLYLKPLRRIDIPYPEDITLRKKTVGTQLIPESRYYDIELDDGDGGARGSAYKNPVPFDPDAFDDPQRVVERINRVRMSPPTYAEKPEVRMAFDVASGSWDWELGDHWRLREAMERELEDGFDGVSIPDASRAPRETAETVCQVVDAIEETIPPVVRRETQLRVDLVLLQRMFDVADDLLMRLVPRWTGESTEAGREYMPVIRIPFDRAIDSAEMALDQGDYQKAMDSILDAASAYAVIEQMLIAFAEADDRAVELRESLDEAESELSFRNNLFLPRRVEVWDRFHGAQRQIERLETALDDAETPEELRDVRRAAERDWQRFEELFEDAVSDHNVRLGVKGLVVVLFVIAAIIGTMAWVRRDRRSSLDTEMVLQSRVDDWDRRFDDLQRRVEELRRRVQPEGEANRQLQEQLNSEATETVDLVFVLSADVAEITAELHRILDASYSPEAKEQKIDALIEEGTLTIEPGEASDVLVFRERLTKPHRFERHRLLEALEELLDDAEQSIDDEIREEGGLP